MESCALVCESYFLSIFPPLLPDNLIAQYISKFQHFPIAQGLVTQLGGKIGIAVTPSILGRAGFHRFLLSVTRSNDVGLNVAADSVNFSFNAG